VTNKTAAARYARALFDVALQEHADLDRVEHDLAAFARLFTDHPALQKVLLNPAVPTPRKRAAIAAITALLKPMPMVGKLVALLAGRDRLVLIPDLLASYRDRLLDFKHVVRAEVTTAAPIAADRTGAVERSLARVTGGQVLISTRVDPSIIGGVVAKVGSTVFDASLARQLQKLKERLTHGHQS